MQANEFVNKYGWDKAALLLSIQGKTIEVLKDEYNPSQLKEFQRYIVSDRLMNLDKLKRLVESHELVKEHGTIERAKEYANSPYTAPEVIERLKQAIADVESCL